MKKYYFTMIIYVDHEDFLNKSIKSIYSMPKDLQKQTKLVIVDPICSDSVKQVVKAWKEKIDPKDICYLETPNAGIGDAYNAAIPEIKGTYVNFSLASTWFDPNALEAVQYVAEKRERPKLISLSPWTVNEKDEFLPYRMSPAASEEIYENVRFYREPEKLQLMFHAYFIRTFLIKSENRNLSFKPELQGDTVMEMLMNLLAEWRGYVYLPKLKFHYTTQLEDNTSAFLDQHYEWWYNDSFKNWILPFVKKWSKEKWPLELSIRTAILYLVFARYNCNYNDRNKNVLTDDKLNEFFELTGEILQYINNDMIFRNGKRSFAIPRSMRMFFLKLKSNWSGCKAEVVTMDNQLYLWMHNSNMNSTDETLHLFNSAYFPSKEDIAQQGKELAYNMSLLSVERGENQVPAINMAYQNTMLIPLCKITTEHVTLNAVNYLNGMLEIDGTFSAGDFLEKEQIQLKLRKDQQIIPVEFSEVYGLNKLFGKTYNHKYQFHVSFSATPIYGNSEISFFFEMNGVEYPVRIRAGSVYAHVREDIYGQYWEYTKGWCLNIVKREKMMIRAISEEMRASKEKVYRNELIKRSKQGDVYAQKALRLREKYFEIKQEKGDQRIWITFDKLYKAGDNGEYMYDYISKQNDGIDIRYLVKKESPDYERMKNKGDKLLLWGEEETLVTVLLAEAVLTTHTNVISYTGFEKELIPYICDLFNPVNMCIQHGLTTQDIAQFQNRLFDNLQLYLCASPNEIQNLSRPIYGFSDPDALKLVGIARYDGLKSNEKKQILITPTWRRNIANSNVAHVKKGHNEFFKNSAYHDIYNRLINDKKLIATAKKYGYRLIYLLHPAASAQIDDFDRNDYVELIPAASDMNYEKILTESSLMVTDYSGVQFDFAYMRKPLIYYHPKELPPHYHESEAYQYKRDGFGPIVDNHQEMVDTLCQYMSEGCVMKPEYVERANKFFEFSDFDNRSRIYDAILKFLNDKRSLD